jgi:hypothetical protein
VNRPKKIAIAASLAVAGVLAGAAQAAKAPKPPPTPTTLSIGVSTTHVTYGASVTLFGRLTGTGSANAPVSLQQAPYPYTHYSNVASGRTNATGAYSFGGVRPGLNTRYRVKVRKVTSANPLVFVRYRVSLSVSDSTPKRGQRVRFSGVVAPAANGRLVLIQRRGANGVYRTTARALLTLRTTTSSRFSVTKRIFSTGTYRARLGADVAHEAGNSRTRRLRVHR